MKKDYVGKKFGRLTVLEEIDRYYFKTSKKGHRKFLCICECGKETKVIGTMLGGNTKSCGCLKIERNTKTGLLKDAKTKGIHPIYNSWSSLLDRCRNLKNDRYKDYGGRGITYNPRREQFENFYEDMKEGRKKGLSIDRIDNNGNYCKENCRWATPKQQSENRRNTVIYKGLLIKDRSMILGVNNRRARYLIKCLLTKKITLDILCKKTNVPLDKFDAILKTCGEHLVLE